MAAVVDAISVVSGILTLVGFNVDLFGSGGETSGSTIRVAAALEGGPGGAENTGGDLPDVRVFNTYGDFVGMATDPGYVGDGNVGSIEVSHDNQNVYTLFSANSDAVCIAWVTVENTDDRGGTKYAVSGDFGRQCGATWYASGMFPTQDREYEPACFWIDADGDQPQTGFQVRWPAFSGDAFDPARRDPDDLCNGVDFGLRNESDPNGINYYEKKKKKKRRRRRQQQRRRQQPRQRRTGLAEEKTAPDRPVWMSEELVISDGPGNSARALCQSSMSMGPDFAHVGEGLYCDMDAKQLYPFCDGGGYGDAANLTGVGVGVGGGQNLTARCFELDTQTLVSVGSSLSCGGRVRPRRASPYRRVRDWRKR